MSAERSRGVRPRAHIPAQAGNFLSRSHLNPLFESQVPGATLVVAPAGYGKSALVNQWARESGRITFWYTVDINDTFIDFQMHVIESISEYFPDFLSRLSESPHIDPIASMNEISKAVGNLQGEFNFVIDNGRVDNNAISPLAQLIADVVPNNIHLVMIRRTTPETSLARYAVLGALSLITSADLAFSADEIEKIANLEGVDLTTNGHSTEISQCHGWPAAVVLMLKNISKGNSQASFADAIATNANPLGQLAIDTYYTMTPENRAILLTLSILEEFDLEIAKSLLGERFSQDYINKLVTDGLFISASSTLNRVFRFNPLIFEALLRVQERDLVAKRGDHEILSDLFNERGEIFKSIEHSYLAGDQQKFESILNINLRLMAHTGRGDLIIQCSQLVGDKSYFGEILRKSVKVVGYLVSLEFNRAEALASELEFSPDVTPQSDFISLLSAGVRSHIFFARGDFRQAQEKIDLLLKSRVETPSIKPVDTLIVMRLASHISLLHDDFVGLSLYYEMAEKIAQEVKGPIPIFHLLCMQSMVLYSQGQYFQAAEIAGIAIEQAKEFGFVGISAPFDAMLVQARAQLEASQLEEAVKSFAAIAELSHEYKIWPWYFMAKGSITRIQASQGLIGQATEQILEQRREIKELVHSNQLGWLVDMSESFLNIYGGDFQRAYELAQRMPPLELVKQIELVYFFDKDSSKTAKLIRELPSTTVRGKITQLLAITIMNMDQEKLALTTLQQALELGAESGYHEYFLRQHRLYPLIIKAAKERPTIYLEGLVQDMALRIAARDFGAGSHEDRLTARELEILKHLTTGYPLSTIAQSLHISQNTMKTHLRNTYRKLGADGRHSAVEKGKRLLLI